METPRQHSGQVGAQALLTTPGAAVTPGTSVTPTAAVTPQMFQSFMEEMKATLLQQQQNLLADKSRDDRSDVSSVRSRAKRKRSSMDTTLVEEDEGDDSMVVQILKSDFLHFKNS